MKKVITFSILCFLTLTNQLNANSSKVKIDKSTQEPQLVIPLPSPICNEGWNYNHHGQAWECQCNEGVEHRVIKLPNQYSINSLDFPPCTERTLWTVKGDSFIIKNKEGEKTIKLKKGK